MNSVTVFKEDSRTIIVIDNPSDDMSKLIDASFGGFAAVKSLAAQLKPVDKPQAEKPEIPKEKAAAGGTNAPKQPAPQKTEDQPAPEAAPEKKPEKENAPKDAAPAEKPVDEKPAAKEPEATKSKREIPADVKKAIDLAMDQEAVKKTGIDESIRIFSAVKKKDVAKMLEEMEFSSIDELIATGTKDQKKAAANAMYKNVRAAAAKL
jgi:outer membrane biosynthesis protein TonB